MKNNILSQIVLFMLAPVVPPNNAELNFSRHYFGVFFDPKVSLHHASRAYELDELVSMVSKIYTKFRVVTMDTLGEDDDDESGKRIPEAVATFNRDHKPDGQPPMQLIMQFRSMIFRSSSQAKKSENFVFVKGLADKANVIFPGSVHMLQLSPLLFEEVHVNLTADYLKTVKPRVDSLQYKLGINLEFGHVCGKSTLQLEHFLPIFSLVEYVLVDAAPDEVYQDGDAEEMLLAGGVAFSEKVMGLLDNCSERILNASPYSTEVGFSSGWPDMMSQHADPDYVGLVATWDVMNKWAATRNAVVVMYEAFDNPAKGLPGSSIGWWRLIQNASYETAKDYVYISKEDILKDAERKRSVIPDDIQFALGGAGDTSSSSSANLSTLFFVGGFIIFVLVFGGVTGLRVYRKFVRVGMDNNGGGLTRKEVQAYFDGETSLFSEHPATSEIQDVAYDRSLELSKNIFTIDKTCILGMGAFGAVFRGKVCVRNAELKVAIKTTKPGCPATALKGLLSEIKVMSYIGKHEHIVGIVGAYTQELSRGKLYVFTELCTLGSLKKHLQNMKEPFANALLTCNEESPAAILSNGEVVAEVSAALFDLETAKLDLTRWANEIADGMEFLASKRVVHADLASRNVLLTEEKVAKISDFGLSRRLHDYEDYVKKQQEPLPWKWMSPESLSQMVFNEKTDVWAFGVTLWEIFSLGDIPYSGLAWNANWVAQLDEGVRLGQPKYDFNNRFPVLMKCWAADPSLRPSFSQLKSLLERNDEEDESPEIEYMELN